MEDADLQNTMNLVELEHRCVQLGRAVSEAMESTGYDFDGETFVVGELIRRAIDANVEPVDLVGYFERQGFIERVLELLH